MIPSKNDTNCPQKIKIQLTSDNKCIIKSTIESADKSKGTINKSEYSINIPDLKDINDNELLTLSKSLTNNQNNDNEDNSNLLISFSNISELNKTKDGGINIRENKENIDSNNILNNINNKQSFDSFSNYNNKSKDKLKENSNIINFKKNINKKNISKNRNYIICSKKVFQNMKSVNTDNLNILHKIDQKESKEKNNNNITSNHNANFTFGGIIISMIQ